jgi:hypothetical protein
LDAWQKAIDWYLTTYERSAANPMPMAYPQLAERVRALFRANTIVHLTSVVREDGTAIRTDIYVGPGELHVVQHDKGWNLVTKGGYVYEWLVGEEEGIKIGKNEVDLVDYILYLTDPSFLMASLYFYAIDNPQLIERSAVDSEGYRTLRLTRPLEGFHSITVSEKPLWFLGAAGGDPGSSLDWEIRVTAPVDIREIPESVLSRTNGIHFEDSNDTLRRHLEYL